MVFRSFRINCILRVLVLGGTISLFFYLVFQTALYATLLIVTCIIVYQIYALIHYVEKTDRDLTRFLDSIKHADFSQTFSVSGLGTAYDNLKSAFNGVAEEFRKARAEKEEQYRYLQTVVQHVGNGLMAFDENGSVELLNTAAKRILKVPYLRNIRGLNGFSQEFVEALFRLKSGERTLVKINDEDELLQLVVYATEFRGRHQNLKLVSIHNIQSELEEKEMEAWQKLIRVLTHEIMNSVTPIASLASTVNEMLAVKQNGKNEVSEFSIDEKEDMQGAVQTIEKRSKGLINFVDAYRKLTRIPEPDFQIFRVSDLFSSISRLMETQLESHVISYVNRIEPESLELTADPELIEQVLINLFTNAIQAVKGRTKPEIRLTARLDERGRSSIQVHDNGPGIHSEALEKIFIPFFTTKRGGTGIGLSLSREIMRGHGGAITAYSKPDEGTVFTLRF